MAFDLQTVGPRSLGDKKCPSMRPITSGSRPDNPCGLENDNALHRS